MDTTFQTDEGVFNYRVCGIIVKDNEILVTKDNFSPYYYLPGGRLNLHETATDAIIRELREELDIEVSIIRPLWLSENFFIEEQNGRQYHEICLYFLVDFHDTDLLSRGKKFIKYEDGKSLCFEWVNFVNLKDMYIYPIFIKDKIFELPNELVFITEKRNI